MTPEQRDVLLDSARYLRNIRPIDPAELTTYVPEATPERIREFLCEQARELWIVERADGTFVPPSEGVVAGNVGSVLEFPVRYAETLLAELERQYGKDWARGESGRKLHAEIREFKEEYYQGRPVDYSLDTAFGYAIYHLPAYYATVQYVLGELLADALLPASVRILDVGAGVGGPALGVHDIFFTPDGTPVDNTKDVLVEYSAVEPSAAASLLAAFLEETTRNFHWSIQHEPIESIELSDEFDIILFANVLSELSKPEQTLTRVMQSVHETGSVVLLSPADLTTSTQLRQLERAVVNGITVYSPTVRLWPGNEPTDRCWSFTEKPTMDVPRFQAALDKSAGSMGEFVNADVQYSYAILRGDGRKRIRVAPSPARFMKLADSRSHVTERVSCIAIKLSHDLGDENPVFLVGDGSQQTDHFCVLTRTTPTNDALLSADYGALLVITRALLLWNADEEAFNLVIDAESTVMQDE